MTDLPERIEAGVATDAEVAVALGFIHKATFAAPGEGWFDGDTLVYPGPANNPPPFTTCLTTLAKECERRGLMWTLHVDPPDFANAGIHAAGGYYDAQTANPAQALCAALVLAVEGETK